MVVGYVCGGEGGEVERVHMYSNCGLCVEYSYLVVSTVVSCDSTVQATACDSCTSTSLTLISVPVGKKRISSPIRVSPTPEELYLSRHYSGSGGQCIPKSTFMKIFLACHVSM